MSLSNKIRWCCRAVLILYFVLCPGLLLLHLVARWAWEPVTDPTENDRESRLWRSEQRAAFGAKLQGWSDRVAAK